MHETQEDLAILQTLLEDSAARAGKFLRESFQIPERSLSADQLAGLFQGLNTVALGTATRSGAPRVAPISALFYRGFFYIPSTAAAARTRMLQANPELSLTYFKDTSLAVILHGRGEVIEAKDSMFPLLEKLQVEHGGSSPREWGEGVFIRVVPRVLYTYAEEPANIPGLR